MVRVVSLSTIAQLTDEQKSFVAAVRDFCARECGTREQREALTDGGRSAHNQDLYLKMAELGWLGVMIPEAYGGSGGGMFDACLLLEEISRGMVPVEGIDSSLIVAGPYLRFGTEVQKQEVLGGIIRGEVEAIVMSEPQAGSDVGNLACKAVRKDGGFVINGQKTWISNAQIATRMLLVARTSTEGSKHDGMTMFKVPTSTAGIEVRGISMMGGGDRINDVFFSDVFVPEDAVVGQVDQAWMQLMSGLNTERLIIAAEILGVGERAFDDLLAYVKEREQFGRPIGKFQAIKHRIAELATELECCRLLVYDVAAKVDADPDRMLPREASMAKLKVTETTKKVALEGLQMMGGYGFTTEFDMHRLATAALIATVPGGTSEIQREIIAGTYGL